MSGFVISPQFPNVFLVLLESPSCWEWLVLSIGGQNVKSSALHKMVLQTRIVKIKMPIMPLLRTTWRWIGVREKTGSSEGLRQKGMTQEDWQNFKRKCTPITENDPENEELEKKCKETNVNSELKFKISNDRQKDLMTKKCERPSSRRTVRKTKAKNDRSLENMPHKGLFQFCSEQEAVPVSYSGVMVQCWQTKKEQEGKSRTSQFARSFSWRERACFLARVSGEGERAMLLTVRSISEPRWISASCQTWKSFEELLSSSKRKKFIHQLQPREPDAYPTPGQSRGMWQKRTTA